MSSDKPTLLIFCDSLSYYGPTGGLPADAPPRPGTARYDEFMKERERRRQMPAIERDKLPPIGSDATTQPAPAATPAR